MIFPWRASSRQLCTSAPVIHERPDHLPLHTEERDDVERDDLAGVPAADHEPPVLAERVEPFLEELSTDVLEDEVDATVAVRRITSATTSWVAWLIPWSIPSSLARASFSSELALPITVAPVSRASCTAADPMPLPTELRAPSHRSAAGPG